MKIIIFLLLSFPSYADIRCCEVPVKRDANGEIARSAAVRAAFQKIYPCPSTGIKTGPCHGWAVDHVIPLACGGYDIVENMQWLKLEIKSCAGADCKDRWERKIYCGSMELVK